VEKGRHWGKSYPSENKEKSGEKKGEQKYEVIGNIEIKHMED